MCVNVMTLLFGDDRTEVINWVSKSGRKHSICQTEYSLFLDTLFLYMFMFQMCFITVLFMDEIRIIIQNTQN